MEVIQRFDKNAKLHNRFFVKQRQQIAVNVDHKMSTDGTVKFTHRHFGGQLERTIIALLHCKTFNLSPSQKACLILCFNICKYLLVSILPRNEMYNVLLYQNRNIRASFTQRSIQLTKQLPSWAWRHNVA